MYPVSSEDLRLLVLDLYVVWEVNKNKVLKFFTGLVFVFFMSDFTTSKQKCFLICQGIVRINIFEILYGKV